MDANPDNLAGIWIRIRFVDADANANTNDLAGIRIWIRIRFVDADADADDLAGIWIWLGIMDRITFYGALSNIVPGAFYRTCYLRERSERRRRQS